MALPLAGTARTVLVVDDEATIRDVIRRYLERDGFKVREAGDGFAALDALSEALPDLIVLDLMLPGIDGFGILRKLRQQHKTPVIILTARGQDEDRIVGLDLGADDYLPKPFNPRELAARIRAILRRVEHRPQAPARFEVNGVTVDPGTREVWCDGRDIDLTTLEFDILDMLMRSAGRVLSRDALMESMYNRKATPFDRSIDMHVSHLRKKLEHGRTLIKTVRGIGYQFCLTGEEEPVER